MADYHKVKSCRICGSNRLRKYLDLGKQPLANGLLDKDSPTPKKYPLQILLCLDCHLSQLSIVVDPKILYNNYPYQSSISKTFRDHCDSLEKSIQEVHAFKGRKSMIDIASNDGCLIEQFAKSGNYITLTGIEPSENLVLKAEERLENLNLHNTYVNFRKSFWNEEFSIFSAGVITCTNILAHVDDVEGFVRGIKNNLSPYGESIAVLEFPYLYDLIAKNEFDTHYHEHLSYFLLKPLRILFEKCGLRIFRAERLNIHGGSLRIFACLNEYKEMSYTNTYRPGRSGSSKAAFESETITVRDSKEIYPTHESVEFLENFEKECGFYEWKTYEMYRERVESLREDIRNLFSQIRGERSKVMAYGASAKGNTLLNYCGLTRKDIIAIIDDTPCKQGKYAPGSNIPIVPYETLEIGDPDYLLLTAWNFAEEIISKTEIHQSRGGNYLLLIPEVKVL